MVYNRTDGSKYIRDSADEMAAAHSDVLVVFAVHCARSRQNSEEIHGFELQNGSKTRVWVHHFILEIIKTSVK